MRQPIVPSEDPIAAEPQTATDSSARLLKSERVQTRARRSSKKLDRPLDQETLETAALEVADAARAPEREVPRRLHRFGLRLVVESSEGLEVLGDSPIERPSVATRLLWKLVFEGEPREVMAVLFLDSRSFPIGYHVAYTGTLDHITASPRQVLVAALLANSSRFSSWPTTIRAETSRRAPTTSCSRVASRSRRNTSGSTWSTTSSSPATGNRARQRSAFALSSGVIPGELLGGAVWSTRRRAALRARPRPCLRGQGLRTSTSPGRAPISVELKGRSAGIRRSGDLAALWPPARGNPSSNGAP